MKPSNRISMAQMVLVCAGVAVLAGCDTMTPEQRGATTGAVIGAVAGQVVGGNTRSTTIGAALGGLGGYVWSRQMEDKKRQMEQATGQVRIMTVHGSKGLQAPIVILADAKVEVKQVRGARHPNAIGYRLGTTKYQPVLGENDATRPATIAGKRLLGPIGDGGSVRQG